MNLLLKASLEPDKRVSTHPALRAHTNKTMVSRFTLSWNGEFQFTEVCGLSEKKGQPLKWRLAFVGRDNL